MCVKSGQSWEMAILLMDRGLYHLNYYGSASCLLCLAIKTSLLNGMQLLCEHELSSVCLVATFWLAAKYELEITNL
jgi:hypothetical protein